MERSEERNSVKQAISGTASSGGAESAPTVYFDGSCPLCTAEIKHYASRQGGERLRFVDISAEGVDLGQDLAASEAMQRFHVRLPDGTLVSGARGFVEIWDALPNWRWLARLARRPGVTAMLELAYRVFLPVRPALSSLAGLLGARAANPRKDTK